MKSTRDLSSAAEPALAAKWSAVHPPDAVRDMEGRRGDREGGRGGRGREGERERGREGARIGERVGERVKGLF